MYVVVKMIENNNFTHFSMLASNGTYVNDDLSKAVMFPTAEIATKQKDVLAALNPDETFVVKQVVLQDLS